ncbi:MAG: ComEC family competence protein [Bacteroidales bacterium]|nr:ComEC family competence protein [Bacteroidales bacterium]
MAFLARNPFLRLVIPLIGGILLQEHFHFAWSSLIAIIAFLLILLIGFEILPARQKFFLEWVRGFLIILIFFAIGAILLQEKQGNKPEPETGKLTFTGQILDIPEEKDKTWQTVIKTSQIYKDSLWYREKIKILAYLEKNGQTLPVKPGDKVLFSAYVNPIKNQGNPGEFNYKRYMAIQGVHYQVYLDKASWKKSRADVPFSVIALSNRLRLHLLNQLKETGIDEEEYGIASALLLGYKDFLTPEVRSRFSSAGAMHILAVSGLHVGIIYLIVHYLLFFMERYPYGKIIKVVIILIILVGYAFLTGLSPSVSRATLMFSVIAIGQVLRRYSSVYNSLAFSAFVLLVINPLLIFSISFQLSYLAVYSIVFFQPRFYKLIELPLIPDKLWQWFTVALAAQIGTAPVVIHHFNLFSNFFWLTNFIAIPAAVFIIFTGMLYFLVAPLLPVAGKALGFILSSILSVLNQSTAFIRDMPYSTADAIWISEIQIFLYYFALIFISAWIIRKNTLYLNLSLGIAIVFLLSDIRLQYKRHEQKEFLVYNMANTSAINYIDGSNNFLLYNGKQKINEAIPYYFKPYWLSKGIKTSTRWDMSVLKKKKETPVCLYKNFIYFNGIKIGYLENDNFPVPLDSEIKAELDYLILANDVNISVEEMRKLFDFQMVILDSSNSYYYGEALCSEMEEKEIPFHSVQRNGAFRYIFD